MDGTNESPERKFNIGERLAVLEVSIQNQSRLMEQVSADIRESARTIQSLVNKSSLQTERLDILREDVDSLIKGLNTKVNVKHFEQLESRVSQNEKLLSEGTAVLRTVNWTIRAFGIGTIGTIIYWLSTGSIPGT